jgi:DNA-binding XRE family transcriptional regulator
MSPSQGTKWGDTQAIGIASVCCMADSLDEERVFNEKYRARIKSLREAQRWSQAEMADLLGVPVDRYKKYETRSPLPLYLIVRFAALTNTTPDFILTGVPARTTGNFRQVVENIGRTKKRK